MLKNLKEKTIKEDNLENSTENKGKNSKSLNKYIKLIILWGVVIVLGITNYSVEKRTKTIKTVFTRNDEVPKETNDKIYIFYPQDEKITNMELIIPKLNSKDELINKTIIEITKKLEEGNFIPLIESREISYYISNDKIYLDLPEKIFNNVTNAKAELLIIYSFVNSLTNIDGIENVRILINNADLEKVKYANLLKDYKYTKNI
ncbi:GerMN domain-containing protein [Fusobacterium sp.]|uniref:GerMN domain-containing protein n=1 Tax=Fusobacterium sp. TaxID=68766 RepID=UPI002624D36C|nr:GerMN domain-containing protein [Fusobacterium sp.]